MDLRYRLHTWGCKVNTYDSGLLEKRLVKAGFAEDTAQPRVHVLNTCAVTAEATKEAIRTIRRIKARDPFSRVVVTGCAAQVDTDQFEDLPGADLVVANSHKGEIEALIKGLFNGTVTGRIHKSNIFRKEDLEAGGGLESSHTRSFLKIQDGCNSFCTYCVIPFARGKSRSIPIKEIVLRVNQLVDQGIHEVVLTGVHIGDYEDNGETLDDLVKAILDRTKVLRVRLGSLEPKELTPEMVALFREPRMCRHFHMSIQSATTRVLSEMRRKYTADDVEFSLQEIQEKLPGSYVGMDVIVGFPGETEEDFQQTFERLARLPWTKIHVFPYSRRPGTKADRFETQIPQAVIKERAKKLRALSDERLRRTAEEQVGSTKVVLPLKNSDDFESLSRDYWPVHLPRQFSPSQEIEVRITEAIGPRLKGVPVHEISVF